MVVWPVRLAVQNCSTVMMLSCDSSRNLNPSITVFCTNQIHYSLVETLTLSKIENCIFRNVSLTPGGHRKRRFKLNGRNTAFRQLGGVDHDGQQRKQRTREEEG